MSDMQVGAAARIGDWELFSDMNRSFATARTPAGSSSVALRLRPEADLLLRASNGMAAELNELVAHTGLKFRIDHDLDRVVVTIVELLSGEVLRQVPSEEALKIARSIARTGRGLIEKAG